MVDIRDYQYDGNNIGDGNLIQVTEHPGASAADRVSQTWFEWRDRAVATKDGVSATETDGIHRPLTVTTYDNLDEVVQVQQYDGDGVTPAIVGGYQKEIDVRQGMAGAAVPQSSAVYIASPGGPFVTAAFDARARRRNQ